MSYPTSPSFYTLNFRSNEPNVISTTQSLRTQARGLGGHRWEFSARYNNMSRAAFQPIQAYIYSLRGSLGVFEIIPGGVPMASGDAVGTVSVSGAHVAGDSTIAVDGFTGTLVAGDVVKFDNHSKVYMVTADLTGPGVLEIVPPLVSDLLDNEEVIYSDVPFTCRLSNDVQSFSVRPPDVFTFEVDFIEAL